MENGEKGLQEILSDRAIEQRKQDKLRHCAEKPLTPFIQFDGFSQVEADSVMRPDKDADCFFNGYTEELMSGCPSVRILITKKTDKKDVLRLLGKLTKWIESTDLSSISENPHLRACLEPDIECPLCHVKAEYLGLRNEFACPKCNSWMSYDDEEGVIEMGFDSNTGQPRSRPSLQALKAAIEHERAQARDLEPSDLPF